MLLSMYVVDITIFSGHLIAGKKSFKTPIHKKKYVLTHRLLYLSIKKTFPNQSEPMLLT